ncbi:MAG: hypothetical protein BAJATHORv1_10211 [Candidatus Thorarchaeota archaeon]|nr:MAG: hypothetical protein BAJATHORv1_10211 [Candidatus Thorarchaeota archaeon]
MVICYCILIRFHNKNSVVQDLVKIRSIARVPTPSEIYSVYVRQRKDASAQIFSLDYGDRLRVFDAKGTLRSTMKWSSKVRCIAVADVEGEGDDALVGGVGKYVLVVDQKGKQLWKIVLESPVIACDARDVDGDDAAEVVVALQNKRVILWNNDQDALFTRSMDSTIVDVWLEDITNDTELEVVTAMRNGNVTIVSSAGYLLKEISLGEEITTFAVLTFGERKLFVTSNLSNTLRFWDIEGDLVDKLDIGGRPRSMATGVPDDISDIAYLVVSTDEKKISFWEVQRSGKASRTEQVVLQQIGSTKDTVYRRSIKCGNCGAPASPESPVCDSCGAQLEMMEEYVIEEYIQESIESITAKHPRIKLKDLDRILRRTLPRPAAYNLRRSLQTMIQSGEIEGHIDGNVFVRTEKPKIARSDRPTEKSVKETRQILQDLLDRKDSFDIDQIEKETGVDRKILRRTLLILLGDGVIEGSLTGQIFTLDDKKKAEEFILRFDSELRNWMR